MLSARQIDRITNTYGSQDGDIELEVRFGHLERGRYASGVTRQTFVRVQETFSKLASPTVIRSRDYIRGNERQTVIGDRRKGEDEVTTWIRKEQLWREFNRDYPFKIVMSREISIPPVEGFRATFTRKKLRYSYLLYGGVMRLDLTIVDETQYEIELELLQVGALANFSSALLVVLRVLLDTKELYSNTEKQAIIKYVNRILQGRPSDSEIDGRVLIQARDLKIRDMVAGGLVGLPDTKEPIVYTVTHKADGLRKMLVFHNGIWLLSPPDEAMLISRSAWEDLDGFILDGEYLVPGQRLGGAPTAPIWYLPFDTIATGQPGQPDALPSTDVQFLTHRKRMELAQFVSDYINAIPGIEQFMTISTKTFRAFTTPNEFFSTMRRMFDEQPSLTFKQDGFLFVPDNVPYQHGGNRHPMGQRILTRYPDILKWKPIQQLTIDFELQWGQRQNNRTNQVYRWPNLLVYSRVGGAINKTRFRGTTRYPFNQTEQVEGTAPILQDLPDGTIVEFGWDSERELMVPHRIRHDKTKPNARAIAENIWNTIHHPITAETLTGDNFELLYRYHNRIKWQLYETAWEGGTLLDIGGGRGGDVNKWQRFRRIVVVEPNEEHRIELARRIESNNLQDRVRILPVGGQDVEAIREAVDDFIGGPIDVVSAMLSLTFFWGSSEMLDRLVAVIDQNLRPGGSFIFLTMDGVNVEQIFHPAFDAGPELSEIKLGPARLRYLPPDEEHPKARLFIDIANTIVQSQTEYLVHLDDLVTRLKERNDYEAISFQRADQESFLSAPGLEFSRLYTYGTIRKVESAEPERPIEVEPAVERPETVEPIPIESTTTVPIEQPVETGSIPLLEIPLTIGLVEPFRVRPEVTTAVTPTPGAIPIGPALEEVVNPYPEITVPQDLRPTPTRPTGRLESRTSGPIEVAPGQLADQYHTLVCGWCPEQAYRIAIEPDDSFLRAILKALLMEYAQGDQATRKQLLDNFRLEVIYSLEIPADGGNLYEAWRQTFMEDYQRALAKGYDVSLEGMAQLWRQGQVPPELWSYLTYLLGFDLIVVALSPESTGPLRVDYYRPATPDRTSLVLVRWPQAPVDHYELMAALRTTTQQPTTDLERGLFQTRFRPNDQLLRAIRYQAV